MTFWFPERQDPKEGAMDHTPQTPSLALHLLPHQYTHVLCPPPTFLLFSAPLHDFHSSQELSSHLTFPAWRTEFLHCGFWQVQLVTCMWSNYWLWRFDSRTTLNIFLLSSGRHSGRESLHQALLFHLCLLLHCSNLVMAPSTPQKCSLCLFFPLEGSLVILALMHGMDTFSALS